MPETVISPQNGSEAFLAVRPRNVMVNVDHRAQYYHAEFVLISIL